jgi:CO/xanthine dehydrogenase FAD-binding subunit
VKPAKFDYVAVDSRCAAVQKMSDLGDDARILAGGQSLIPLLSLRMSAPSVLIDINNATDMAYLHLAEPSPGTDTAELRIGGLTRHYELVEHTLTRTHCGLLASAAGEVGHTQIRNRGTLGGSVAHADPHAEYPMVLSALDARVVCESTSGVRTVPAADFFIGAYETARHEDEVVVEVRIPVLDHGGWGFYELASRPGDFPLFAVAVVLKTDQGRIVEPRVWMIGVSDHPVRLESVEATLVGHDLRLAGLADAAATEAAGVELANDEDLPTTVQRRMLTHGARTALQDAIERAVTGSTPPTAAAA